MTGLQSLLVRHVGAYIELHYRERISLRDVAVALGYSRSHLTSTVRVAIGKPLNAWIIERRITAAQERLADPSTTVAEVASAVGFGDTAYFCRKFKQLAGMTPSAWRRAHTEVPRSAAACPACGHLLLPAAPSTWAAGPVAA